MSIVTAHALAASTQSFAMIGAETVAINGTGISCVLAEADESKTFGEVGFEPAKRITAVCKTSALPSGTLLKKVATARSETWRVEGIRKGGSFTTLTLEEIHKA
jgi:hypothetical protein